jgi:hypothetical protein
MNFQDDSPPADKVLMADKGLVADKGLAADKGLESRSGLELLLRPTEGMTRASWSSTCRLS